MAKKLTVAEKFALVENILKENGNTELAEFIAERSALHTKKSANRKPNATQIANEKLGNAITDFLSANPNSQYTISALIKSVAECEGLSNQKVSAIVRLLVGANKVEKLSVKGTSYFKIAE